MLLLLRGAEGQWSRLLRDVWVVRVGIHAQLAAKDLATKRRLRQHAVHRLLDHTLRMLLQHRAEGREASMPHVAGVTEVLLVLGLSTGHSHFGCVDDDDSITRIHVRREDWLVLAANDLGDLTRESAEDHAFGIDDEPLLLDIARAGAKGPSVHD